LNRKGQNKSTTCNQGMIAMVLPIEFAIDVAGGYRVRITKS
jgi:hypothetical protein